MASDTTPLTRRIASNGGSIPSRRADRATSLGDIAVTAKPTRAEIHGRCYLDLQKLARQTGRPTDELIQLYGLEGFLARLVESEHANALVLKGGVLLAALGSRRPTRDVDLQARSVSNDIEAVRSIVGGILHIDREDGLVFDLDGLQAHAIREDDAYSGVRVSVAGKLARAQLQFHIDVNVGDPIWPAPQMIDLPLMLGGHLKLLGYPLAMVYAEKLLTAIERGTANTRWRDFADVYVLTGRHEIDAAELFGAIQEVVGFRGLETTSLASMLNGYAALGQSRWIAWRRKQRLEDRLPGDFAEVLGAVQTFADPVLTGVVVQGRWDADRRMWVER